jgi:hypothetical protein
MDDKAEKIIRNALAEAVPELNDAWTDKSKNFGWDTQLSALVKVEPSEGGLSVTYPEDSATQIEDAEYGFKAQPPKAALRDFTGPGGELSKRIDKAVYQALTQLFISEGLIK